MAFIRHAGLSEEAMSQENVELVRSGYERFNAGERENPAGALARRRRVRLGSSRS